jgi:short subunit dehydrogenase-like uncharacterized protein
VTGGRREFDLVVWGATGYVGGLLAASIAEVAPPGLRWALGGRDERRLTALRAALPAAPAVLVADAFDEASLNAMTRRTRVVASTVGPYAEYGTPLVAACVAGGSDYADITGEVAWMRRSIEAFDAPARATGVRLVHACGLDSLPSDLGVWLLQRTALQRHGRPCHDVTHVVGPLRGGLSGGTVASTLGVLASASRDPAVRGALADPDVLAPGAVPAPSSREPWWPQRAPDARHWTAPFPMAAVNTRVVRRTRALLGEPWGSEFRYRERLWAGNWALAAALGIVPTVGRALAERALVRRVARLVLPRPGDGPDGEALAGGYFRSRLIGFVAGVAEPVVVEISMDVEPGYLGTARMLREVVLALAAGELDAPGGVVTPAFVGRERLLERLTHAGIRIRVLPEPGLPDAAARGSDTNGPTPSPSRVEGRTGS